MKKHLAYILLAFIISINAHAQNQGAENSAMGIIGIANQSLFSMNANPANLGLLDSVQIGINIKQISLYGKALESGLQIASPIKNIHGGVGIYNFGNRFYNFGQLNFALAKVLDEKQGIGISIKYFKEFVYLNSNERALNASIGYYYQLSSKLRLGAKIQQVFYRSDERLERTYSQVGSEGGLGLHLSASRSLIFNAEIVSSEINALRVGAGMQLIKDKYSLLFGLSSHQSLVNVGITIPINALTFSLAYGYHQRIGSNLQTSLIYQW